MDELNVKLRTSALVNEVGERIMRWQEAAQRFDEAVGRRWKLAASERLCLSFLARGPQSASAIAHATQLTPAAVTALVDRLEARGFVSRGPDPADRRRVLVGLAKAAEDLIRTAYTPLQQAGNTMLSGLSEDDLKTFSRLLGQSIDIQEDMRKRLEALPAPDSGKP
ncbi:MAG: MarR family transcriptional regulator [Devosia sp.]|uniref:MarR family winged helix-turn-helix transcriptional regulator n=1 Tax=Devosia sp. TaxID=1871048 RepID=UPI0024C644B7|nr:MarR family transcriptional regulator [Devosia sp.]UYN98155.1 MAG: MarR family transcriptional regulator [Devosia sp.]